MGETTTIEWTRNDDGTPGRTWNPVTGCTKVSAGCDNCYASSIAERFRGSLAFPHGFDVTLRSDRVNDPLTWRKPTRVFVNSMSDLFHDELDQAWIAGIFAVMAAARKHTFQLLTKRHARMRYLLNNPEWVDQVRSRAIGKGLPADQWQWPLPGLWLGVSVENQQWANIRIPALLRTPAAVRFLSCEPLLGPIDLKQAVWSMGSERGHGLTASFVHASGCCLNGLHGIGWCVVGGESGGGARPASPEWFRSLRDQCETASVPFFFKQHGAYRSYIEGPWRAPSLYVNAVTGEAIPEKDVPKTGHWTGVYRLGKGAAGRKLDGVEHNEFPIVHLAEHTKSEASS